jgi:hypothetical protein
MKTTCKLFTRRLKKFRKRRTARRKPYKHLRVHRGGMYREIPDGAVVLNPLKWDD